MDHLLRRLAIMSRSRNRAPRRTDITLQCDMATYSMSTHKFSRCAHPLTQRDTSIFIDWHASMPHQAMAVAMLAITLLIVLPRCIVTQTPLLRGILRGDVGETRIAGQHYCRMDASAAHGSCGLPFELSNFQGRHKCDVSVHIGRPVDRDELAALIKVCLGLLSLVPLVTLPAQCQSPKLVQCMQELPAIATHVHTGISPRACSGGWSQLVGGSELCWQ